MSARTTGLLVVTSTLLLGGCNSLPQKLGLQTQQPAMEPAPLPQLQPGQYFSYSDGVTDVVTERKGGRLHWLDSRGVRSTSFDNFVIPELTWTSSSRKSSGSTSAEPSVLWPLKKGNQGKIFFNQEVTSLNDGSSRILLRDWNCEVTGTEVVEVPAGRFDTYRIECKRYQGSSKNLQATRIFNYAPEVGHYVIRDDRYRSGLHKRRELVKLGFNSKYLERRDQKSLVKTLNRTLASNRNGESSLWRNKSRQVAVILTPTSDFKGSDGSRCRDYRSNYSVAGRPMTHTRRVCLVRGNGQWQRVTTAN